MICKRNGWAKGAYAGPIKVATYGGACQKKEPLGLRETAQTVWNICQGFVLLFHLEPDLGFVLTQRRRCHCFVFLLIFFAMTTDAILRPRPPSASVRPLPSIGWATQKMRKKVTILDVFRVCYFCPCMFWLRILILCVLFAIWNAWKGYKNTTSDLGDGGGEEWEALWRPEARGKRWWASLLVLLENLVLLYCFFFVV